MLMAAVRLLPLHFAVRAVLPRDEPRRSRLSPPEATMPSASSRSTIPALFALSLLLNVVFVSCSADAVTSPLPQTTDPAVAAQLAAIAERLDSIDSRTQRIDQATTQAIDTILSALSDPDGTFLMEIASAVSVEAGVGTSLCAEVGPTFSAQSDVEVLAVGRGRASIGPSALEAEAMAEAKVDLNLDGAYSAGLEGGVTASVCVSADLGLDLIAVGTELRSQLESMGVTGAAITNLINRAQPPATVNFASVSGAVESALPVPSGLQTVFANPATVLRDSPALAQFALDSRCDPSFFPSGAFSDTQSRMCALSPSIPTAEDYIGIVTSLSVLPQQTSDLTLGLASVCGTVNTIRNRDAFSIPSRSISIAGTTYTTFPGFTRSFATVPALSC